MITVKEDRDIFRQYLWWKGSTNYDITHNRVPYYSLFSIELTLVHDLLNNEDNMDLFLVHVFLYTFSHNIEMFGEHHGIGFK